MSRTKKHGQIGPKKNWKFICKCFWCRQIKKRKFLKKQIGD